MGKTLNPIRQRRQAAGLSREQLAVRAGVSSTTLGWAERAHYLSRATATKLATALRCDPVELLPRSGRP